MKRTIFLLIATVIIGALPLLVQYGQYVMCTDMFSQEIPFIMETKRMLASGLPLWSWNTFYGDNFWASYGFYTLTSPFVWLLCLLPYAWIPKCLIVVLILKYLCAFITSRAFMLKMDISQENAAVGGLLYAFSSFTISNSFYFHFFEPLIVFPLLLIAVERFLLRERYGCTLLLGSSFLTVFINYYFAVCSFVAAVLYTVCRLSSKEMRAQWRRVPLGVGMVVIGIVLDTVLLLPTALQLAGGPRTDGHLRMGLDGSAVVLFASRLRTLFVPQLLEEPTSLFYGSGFNSMSSCLPMLGMVAVAMYCWRNRRTWIAALAVVSIIFFLTPLNSVFSLFTDPGYTRGAYTLCLFMAFASCKWLDEEERLPLSLVLCYGIVAFGIFAADVCFSSIFRTTDLPVIPLACYIVVVAVNIIALVIYTLRRTRSVLLVCISLCGALQMALFHYLRSDAYFNTDERETFVHAFKYPNYRGLVRQYVVDNKLPRLEGNMHYRTASISRFANMAMFTNRPDVKTFHSIQNNVVRRLFCAGDKEFKMRRVSVIPNCNERSLYALMSVRDVIAHDDHYVSLDKKNLNISQEERGKGYTIYRNNDYLPMGFAYDTYVDEALIDTLNQCVPKTDDVPLQLLANLSVPKHEKAFFARHLRRGSLVKESANTIDSVVAERRKCVASSFEGTTTGFVSHITVDKPRVIFYSVPADKGFTAYVDGYPTAIHECNLGLSAILVPSGSHEVDFHFVPRGMCAGAAASFVALLFAAGVMLYEHCRTL